MNHSDELQKKFDDILFHLLHLVIICTGYGAVFIGFYHLIINSRKVFLTKEFSVKAILLFYFVSTSLFLSTNYYSSGHLLWSKYLDFTCYVQVVFLLFALSLSARIMEYYLYAKNFRTEIQFSKNKNTYEDIITRARQDCFAQFLVILLSFTVVMIPVVILYQLIEFAFLHRKTSIKQVRKQIRIYIYILSLSFIVLYALSFFSKSYMMYYSIGAGLLHVVFGGLIIYRRYKILKSQPKTDFGF